MKKSINLLCLLIAMIIVVGCGTQNEYLSKGKEWVKSDKRGRIARAVAQFELAISNEPDNAEAHYLLGYYDESATIERRAEQMVLAYKYDKRKYQKILIEEALRDRDENIRKSAAKALQYIHSRQIGPVIKPLVKTLKSKDSRDRDDAAMVLSILDDRKTVLDRLIQADIMENKRMGTRFDAVRALGNIGDSQAIEPLMERITALKTEEEKGEEPEVRRAAVVSLRQIAKRDVLITGKSLDIQVEPAEEGVSIAGSVSEQLSNDTTLHQGELISQVIDNKKIKSLEDYNNFLAESMERHGEVTFGLPKTVKISVSKMDEIGIEQMSPGPDGKGIMVEKLTIDSRAGKLGIEKGEVISHINYQPVNSAEDYKEIVSAAISNGDSIMFRVADEDKYRQISISAEGSTDLGMVVQELPEGTNGVIITSVRPRSPAVKSGIRKGQIISYVVVKEKVDSVDTYKRLMESGLADGKVTISVINKTAVQKLIEVLRNKGLIVRFDAAQALGEVRDKAAVDSLIEMLQEQANPIDMSL